MWRFVSVSGDDKDARDSLIREIGGASMLSGYALPSVCPSNLGRWLGWGMNMKGNPLQFDDFMAGTKNALTATMVCASTVPDQLVRDQIADFLQSRGDMHDKPLRCYVAKEIEQSLGCGGFARGFVHRRCVSCAYTVLGAFSRKDLRE